jgi:hypothetical protein
MINELAVLWKEAIIAKFEALFSHSPDRTNKIQKTSLGIIGLWTDIWTQDFPNAKKKKAITAVQRYVSRKLFLVSQIVVPYQNNGMNTSAQLEKRSAVLGLTREWSDPTCRNLPWFFFVHRKSTHNKIHYQNSSC